MERCLKQLGLLAVDNKCPPGCSVVEKAAEKIWESGCCSKEGQKKIVNAVSAECPAANLMVLPSGSNRMRL